MSSEAKRNFILSQLRGIVTKDLDDRRATIVCPYHNDTEPSGTVNLNPNAGAPLGWYKCWACPASYPWDDLATRLGLKKWKDEKKTADDYLNPSQFRDMLVTEDDTEDAGWQDELDELKLSPLTSLEEDEWRSVPLDFLHKVGCKLAHHSERNRYYIWMPVYIKEDLKGYVKANLKKPKSYTFVDEKGNKRTKTPPSYVNAPGTWSKEFGLLFYDYAAKLIKRKGLNTIVLCEGPRDALRLLRAGIPAVAVLGALNWNDSKRFVLEGLEVENLILFMDGDTAGKEATKAIYANCRTHFNTKFMSLWKHVKPVLDEKGNKVLNKNGTVKMTKLDPFSCPKKFIQRVKRNLV